MIDGLERDTDIITIQSKAEAVEDALTGTDFDRVAEVNDGGSITTSSNTAGANSLLIVKGTIAGGQTVQGDQTVQGGGSTIQVRGRRSGTVFGFTASGTRPTVTTGAGDILTLAGNNTHIAGLFIDGQATSNHGIFAGSDKSNLAFTQNRFANIGGDGIVIWNDNSDIIIDQNTMSAMNSDGIFFNDRNRNITITNNILTGGSSEGIDIDDDNSNITITNNLITDFVDSIEIDNRNSNILIANNTLVSDPTRAGEAIEFRLDNTGITIRDNTISANDNAIEINNNNNTGSITGNTITTMTGDGIQLGRNADTNNTFTVTGNTFGAIGGAAIRIANNSNVTITDNTFNSAIGTFLLDVDGTGNALSGAGNTASVAVTCQSGTFTGTVTVSGVILQDGVAPCN